MNRTTIDKIRNHYNPEHDLGPDAPVQWSVMELAELVARLIDKVESLEAALENDEESPAETIRQNADAKRWSK